MPSKSITALPVPEQEPYVTRQELAAFLKVHVHTVDQYRKEGCPHDRWGQRTIRFRKSLVLAWLRERGRQAA
jgi:phage terminase Nu1 subunit (DNA packaging protein)